MQKEIKFRSQAVEIIIMFLIVVNLIENLFTIFNEIHPVKIFQICFLTTLIGLYLFKNPKFIILLKVWGMILFFFSSIGLVFQMLSFDGVDPRLLVLLFGVFLGVLLFYLADRYIKIEHLVTEDDDNMS